MAQLMTMPNLTNPVLSDWQQVINMFCKIHCTYFFMDISESTGSNDPVVKKGSKYVHYNSYKEIVNDDEPVYDWNSFAKWNILNDEFTSWLYGNAVEFRMYNIAPTFDMDLSGYYAADPRGSSYQKMRAIAQFRRKSMTDRNYWFELIAPEWMIGKVREGNPLHYNSKHELDFKFPIIKYNTTHKFEVGDFIFCSHL